MHYSSFLPLSVDCVRFCRIFAECGTRCFVNLAEFKREEVNGAYNCRLNSIFGFRFFPQLTHEILDHLRSIFLHSNNATAIFSVCYCYITTLGWAQFLPFASPQAKLTKSIFVWFCCLSSALLQSVLWLIPSLHSATTFHTVCEEKMNRIVLFKCWIIRYYSIIWAHEVITSGHTRTPCELLAIVLFTLFALKSQAAS